MKRTQAALLLPLPATAYAYLHTNKLDLLQQLLESGKYNVDAYEPPMAMTLLCEAAFHRRMDVVRMCFNAGASIEQCSPFQFNKEFLPRNFMAPPLFFAIDSGDVNMVKMFIERGANPNVMLHGAVPLMYYLITRNNFLECELVDMLLRFLSVGARVNERVQPPPLSALPLHAMYTPQVPLLCALHEAKLEVVKVLLQHGADVSVRDANGCSGANLLLGTLFYSAEARASQLTLLSSLRAAVDDIPSFRYGLDEVSAVHRAAQANHAPLVKQLLAWGCDARYVDLAGATALDVACVSRVAYFGGESEIAAKLSIVQMLIQAGAPVRARSHVVMAIRKWWDVALCLLSGGADVNAVVTPTDFKHTMHECECDWPDMHQCRSFASLVREGDTALIMAILCNDLSVVMALIREGADVNMRAADGMTPLHIACAGRRAGFGGPMVECAGHKMVLALLRAGADVNAEWGTSTSIITPLGSVTISPSSRMGQDHALRQVVDLLIRCDAAKFTADCDAMTVWTSALKLRTMDVAFTLIQHGAALASPTECIRLAEFHEQHWATQFVLAAGHGALYAGVKKRYSMWSPLTSKGRRALAAHSRRDATPSFIPRMKWEE